MPIYQADLQHCRRPSLDPESESDPEPGHVPVVVEPSATKLRRLSEESLRTELCEGPVPDSPGDFPSTPERPKSDDEPVTSSRAELIERLKRGQSPTWILNRHVRDCRPDVDTLPSEADCASQFESILQNDNSVSAGKTSRASPESSTLLPPAQITPERNETAQGHLDDRLRDGLNIQRPRSALHSGDFTHDEAPPAEGRRADKLGDLNPRPNNSGISTDYPWMATSPPRDFTPFQFEKRLPGTDSGSHFRSGRSSLSSALSSSFVYQPPTSPLVQSETNDEFDLSGPLADVDFSPDRRASRRHTLNIYNSSPFESPASRSSIYQRMSLRRESSLPYQAHQPRRSLTSTPSYQQPGQSPQSLLRSRRPSFGSDSSPIQHASMVGSYEESILRGRMSTTPSKPFDFLAQIGVLGKGKCKSSLRCPAHVTLPFPAVYYNYSSTPQGRTQSNDGPSPYVGQVDLENGLPNLEEESRSRRKVQSRYTEKRPADGDMDTAMPGAESGMEHRKKSRAARRSGSPKAPPGGSYRLPQKGQLQIIIKNQNKTAVKLFLVPYDLSGMEPGTKTFIRQRSYSASLDTPDGPSPPDTGSMNRPILRYLVHLHICSPARGRYYLYKSIRVVFANRVPDGKEKLRNETTWPEPRFTPYKPIRVMHPPLLNSTGPGAMLTADKANRRRSLGVSVGASSRTFDMADTVHFPERPNVEQATGFGGGNTLPLEPIPFRLPARDRGDSDSVSDSTTNTAAGMRSPDSSQASRPSTKDDSAAGYDHWGAARYEKLSKGDFGYGGNAFGLVGGGSGGGPPGGKEGLLSQRLRSLGVRPRPPGTQDDLS